MDANSKAHYKQYRSSSSSLKAHKKQYRSRLISRAIYSQSALDAVQMGYIGGSLFDVIPC